MQQEMTLKIEEQRRQTQLMIAAMFKGNTSVLEQVMKTESQPTAQPAEKRKTTRTRKQPQTSGRTKRIKTMNVESGLIAETEVPIEDEDVATS